MNDVYFFTMASNTIVVGVHTIDIDLDELSLWRLSQFSNEKKKKNTPDQQPFVHIFVENVTDVSARWLT